MNAFVVRPPIAVSKTHERINMLKLFNETIKPFNDALAGTLGIKTIDVIQDSKAYDVPVKVDVLTPNGKAQVKAQNINFYRSLGLNIRSLYE